MKIVILSFNVSQNSPRIISSDFVIWPIVAGGILFNLLPVPAKILVYV